MSVFMERLQDLMDEHEMSDRDLVRVCELSKNTVTNWRKGMKPQTAMVDKLAAYFNVPRDYLLGLDDLKKDMLAALDTPQDSFVKRLLHYYDRCDNDGKLRIIQVAMNEYDRTRGENL